MSDPVIMEIPEDLEGTVSFDFYGTVMQGPTGKSAYDHAVDNGFNGTVVEFLESLRADNTAMRIHEGMIQWSNEVDVWYDLIEIEQLRGEKGDKGDSIKGDTGDLVDLEIGTVVSLPYGSSPVVEVVGDDDLRTLNFQIPEGPQGVKGDTGDRSWTPVLQLVADGERRVFSVDWANGSGTKPVVGYLSASGVSSDIAEAINVRGPTGAAGDGVGDMVAANNLSEVDPEIARENLQAAHEGGFARFTSVNLGTAGGQLFTDNDGSVLVHTGSPALSEAYFDFDRHGNLTAHQGTFLVGTNPVYHSGNLDLSPLMPKSGGDFTNDVRILRGAATARFTIASNAGQPQSLFFSTGNSIRWKLTSNSDGESGSNNGSNFEITRYTDAGAAIDSPLIITRSTGRIRVGAGGLQVNGPSSVSTLSATGVVSAFGASIETPNSDYSVLEFKKSSYGREFAIFTDPRTSATAGGSLYVQAHGNDGVAYNFMAFDRENGAINILRPTYFDSDVNFNIRPSFNGVAPWDANNFNPNTKLNTASPVATGTMQAQHLRMEAAAGGSRQLRWTSNGLDRWVIHMETGAESGDSGGGHLWFQRGNNAGTLSPMMHMDRNSGNITVMNSIHVNGSVVTNTINGGSTGVTLSGSGEFNITGSGGLRVGGNKIRFGNTASSEGFTYLSGTMYLENNRNFNIGSGVGTGSNWVATSDERLKTNWRSAADDGWTRQLPNILHGAYDRTDGVGNGVGVSAQQFQKLLPGAVKKDSNGYLGIDYGQGAMMATIDLAKRVSELEELVMKLLKDKI